MPRNRLAFTVRVGCQIQGICLAHSLDDHFDLFLAPLSDRIVHAEVMGRIDSPVFRDEVADVTDGSHHLEVLAQVLLDGLGFGGRFDDDEVLAHGSQKRDRGPNGRGPLIYIVATRRWRVSMQGVRRSLENEVLHPLIGLLLAGLAEQDHQHDPFDLFNFNFFGL